MKILLHNEYKIINLSYPTYVYQFFNFPYNYKNRVLACFQTRPTPSSTVRCFKLLTALFKCSPITKTYWLLEPYLNGEPEVVWGGRSVVASLEQNPHHTGHLSTLPPVNIFFFFFFFFEGLYFKKTLFEKLQHCQGMCSITFSLGASKIINIVRCVCVIWTHLLVAIHLWTKWDFTLF